MTTVDVVATRRALRDPRPALAMAAMAAGMLDTMLFGVRLLPAPAWIALYLGLAIAVAVRPAGRRCCTPMALHRALGLVVMAGLTALMAPGAGGAPGASGAVPDAGDTSMAGMAMGSGARTAVLAAGFAYCLYTAWSAMRRGHTVVDRAAVWRRAEIVLGGAAVAGMTAAVLLA